MKNKNIIIFISIVFVIEGCSLIPNRHIYQNFLTTTIGTDIHSLNKNYPKTFGTKIKKIKNISNREHYFIESAIDCKFILITNKQNIIIDYEILTPKTCVGYYSSAW